MVKTTLVVPCYNEAARLDRAAFAAALDAFEWLSLLFGDDGSDDATAAVLARLAMGGRLLVRPADAADEVHLRVRLSFTDGGPELRFVDQLTFGGLALVRAVRHGCSSIANGSTMLDGRRCVSIR